MQHAGGGGEYSLGKAWVEIEQGEGQSSEGTEQGCGGQSTG